MLSILSLGLVSCRSTSFLGQKVDNFTAYYNTFYNARKALEEARRAIEHEDAPVDMHRYLPLFPSPKMGTQNSTLERAIKKGADLLRKHPRSKWVDDALLLIGQAYFYQENFVGAEQKFRELIGLGGPLEREARFWLIRSLMASRQYDLARNELEAALLEEDLPVRWHGLFQALLGELYAREGRWEEAAAALEKGLGEIKDRRLRARAYFLLGQIYERLGQYGRAEEAYRTVLRQRPLYELTYAAQVSAIRMQAAQGHVAEALAALERMERDDKHYGRIHALYLLRAQILAEAGEHEAARALYLELLYGERPVTQELRGEVHYYLARLYREVYRDYEQAAAHLDTAATRLGGLYQHEAFVTPLAIRDAREQADVLQRFVRLARQVAERDSLLYLGGLDPATFDSLILVYRKQRAEALAREQKALEQRQVAARFQETRGQVEAPTSRRDELLRDRRTGTRQLGFLFYKDPLRVKEQRAAFVARWGERPLVPNWRRREALSLTHLAETTASEEVTSVEKEASEALPELDLSPIPRTPEARRAMREERARLRYELGNTLFLTMQEPDSAAAWYRRIIEEDTASSVVPQAWYALAEIALTEGDTVRAHRLYRELLARYPETELARVARQRLGEGRAVVQDSLRLAEAAYARAYALWQAGDLDRALEAMQEVARTYARTPVYPKALLAAGLIYHARYGAGARQMLDSLWAPLLKMGSTPYGERARHLLQALEEETEPAEGSR